MPRVSVIVPAYNAEPFLQATLFSVQASEFTDYEVVVIDDGSTDRTAEVAKSAGPVRLLRQANMGLSASRNRGMAESDSEFVALLDADDLWHPRKLSLQIDALLRDPGAGLSFSEFLAWDGSVAPVFPAHVDGSVDIGLSGWIYHRMIMTNFVLPSSAVLRRSALEGLAPIPCVNQKTDDWEYFTRLSTAFRFTKLRAPLVAYRQSAGSLSKRISPINETELMRAELLARYGLSTVHGGGVDVEELARRRYKGDRDFADSHVSQGSLRLGLAHFAGLLARGPQRSATLVTLAKSCAKRATRVSHRRTRNP